jgi:hypothetical protein
VYLDHYSLAGRNVYVGLTSHWPVEAMQVYVKDVVCGGSTVMYFDSSQHRRCYHDGFYRSITSP